jgi:hypothetical protein
VKTAATVGVACALGGLAASAALGQVSVPIPTVTVPTVSVPSATVPSVTVPVPTPPRPPAPTVPAPVPTPPPAPTPTVRTPTVATPAVTASARATPTPSVSAGTSGGGLGSNGSAPSGGGSSGSQGYGTPVGSTPGTPASGTTAGSPAAAAATAASGEPHGRTTRPWIAVRGPAKRRTATFVFRLGRRGAVEITVVQVSPVCRIAAKFRVGGRAGTNRVTIGRGAHGAELTPGTYRVVGRTRDGRVVLRQVVVVVQARAPSPAALAFARRSNVCGARGITGAGSTTGSLAAASLAGPGDGSQSTITRNQRQSGESEATGDARGGRPLTSGISDAVAQATRDPLVILLLGLSALIFAVAAMPRTAIADPRLLATVVSHRAELAVTGAAVLALAIAAMLLG